MRTAIIRSALTFVFVAAWACDDGGGGGSGSDGDSDSDVEEAFVEGHFEFVGVDSFDPAGSLAQGGAEYYGYCTYGADTGVLELEVGDDKRNAIDSASETYVKFTGIQGPPVEGVYSDALAKVPKEGDELATVFGDAILASGGNEFVFSQPDDPSDCHVALFAEAVEGEVTKTGEEEFTYYVEFLCPSLDGVESEGGTQLTGFAGYFFFDGCQEL